jgi:hypothetical protein
MKGSSPISLVEPLPMSEGASVLEGLVSKFYGGASIGHVNPALLLSSDDTKVYIFEGTDTSGQSKWRLTDATSVAENRTHSIYETAESQSNMCGMRVTLSVTLNATGQIIAGVFVVVSGLSDNEIPEETCPEGMIHMEIEGLAMEVLLPHPTSKRATWSSYEVMEQIHSIYVVIFCTDGESSYHLSTTFVNLLAKLPVHWTLMRVSPLSAGKMGTMPSWRQ